MKNNKILVVLFAGLLVFSSCKDYLSLTPISEIGSNGFYSTTAQVETGVLAIYDGMQTMVQAEYALTEMRSDNANSRNHEGEYAQLETLNANPNNSIALTYWSNNYNIIFRANIVLANLGAVTIAAKKSQYEGEAKFARALCNFNLVRAFGNIPLVLKVITADEAKTYKQASKAEVMASIISDLKDAVSFLPARAGIGEGRATVGAANALLAKVYLTNGDYVSAKAALDAVSTTDYSLDPVSYNNVFFVERGKEIIFSVQFIADNAIDSELYSLDFTSKGRATGLNFPTNDLMNIVDATDKRKATLFLYETAISRWECGKFKSSSVNTSYGGNDWIVLRYADVLLMKVEAIMAGAASTNDAAALTAFNAIRTRAGLPTVTTITKTDLLKERRIEFAFEDQRLYDLIRFGVADAVLTAFSKTTEANYVYKSTGLLLPIPQSELNMYPLVQNPGYTN